MACKKCGKMRCACGGVVKKAKGGVVNGVQKGKGAFASGSFNPPGMAKRGDDKPMPKGIAKKMPATGTTTASTTPAFRKGGAVKKGMKRVRRADGGMVMSPQITPAPISKTMPTSPTMSPAARAPNANANANATRPLPPGMANRPAGKALPPGIAARQPTPAPVTSTTSTSPIVASRNAVDALPMTNVLPARTLTGTTTSAPIPLAVERAKGGMVSKKSGKRKMGRGKC